MILSILPVVPMAFAEKPPEDTHFTRITAENTAECLDSMMKLDINEVKDDIEAFRAEYLQEYDVRPINVCFLYTYINSGSLYAVWYYKGEFKTANLLTSPNGVNNAIGDGDVYYLVTKHTLEYKTGKLPTCTDGGVRDYYECTVCGKILSDKQGTKTNDDYASWCDGNGWYQESPDLCYYDDLTYFAGITVDTPFYLSYTEQEVKDIVGQMDWVPEVVDIPYEINVDEVGMYAIFTYHFIDGEFAYRLLIDAVYEEIEDYQSSLFYITGIPYIHDLEEIPAEDVACGTAGHKAYYQCKDCGRYFENSDGSCYIADVDAWLAGEGATGDICIKQLSDDEMMNPKTVYRKFSEDEIVAACTAHYNANTDKSDTTRLVYFYRDPDDFTCFLEFGEGSCLGSIPYNMLFWESYVESNNNDVMAFKVYRGSTLEHDIKEVAAVSPTCAADGHKAYYKCDNCNKCYSDENCTRPIEDIDAWLAGDGAVKAKPELVEINLSTDPDVVAEDVYSFFEGDFSWDNLSTILADVNATLPGLDGYSELPSTYNLILGFSESTQEFHIQDFTNGQNKYYPGNLGKSDLIGQTAYGPVYYVRKGVDVSHDIVSVEACEAVSCAVPGYKAYYQCQNCDACFEDAAGTTAIGDINEWKNGAGKIEGSHTPVLQNGDAATCIAPGTVNYYKCSLCNKYFKDATCANEITDLDAWKAGEGSKSAFELFKSNGSNLNELFGDIGVMSLEEAVPLCDSFVTANRLVTSVIIIYSVADGGYSYIRYYNGIAYETGVYTKQDIMNSIGFYSVYRAMNIYGDHDLEATQSRAATCTTDGFGSCWKCKLCNKYFADSAAATEITDIEAWKLADGKVPAAHTPVYQEGDDATCISAATFGYYKCSACNKYFEDYDCTTEIADLDAWKAGDGSEPAFTLITGENIEDVLDDIPETSEERAVELCNDFLAKNPYNEIIFIYSYSGTAYSYLCYIGNTLVTEGELTREQIAPTGDPYTVYRVVDVYGDHDLEEIQGLTETCTANGYKSCWKCKVCNKYFEDENCATAIADYDAWKLAAGKIAAHHTDDNNDYVCDKCRKEIFRVSLSVPERGLNLGLNTSKLRTVAYNISCLVAPLGVPAERISFEYAGSTLDNDESLVGQVPAGATIRVRVRTADLYVDDQIENGTLTVTGEGAEKTVTVTPAAGYELSTITAKDERDSEVMISGSTPVFTIQVDRTSNYFGYDAFVTATFVMKDEVREIIDMIEELSGKEPLTLEDRETYDEIMEKYEALGEEDKPGVENFEDLEDVDETITALENQKAADDFEEMVDEIGEITPDSKETLEEVRRYYEEELNPEQKELAAEALAELEEKEAEYERITDRGNADEVIEMIDALPETITVKDKEAVEAARAAYNALNDYQKSLVTNNEKLLNAEKALEAALKETSENDGNAFKGDFLKRFYDFFTRVIKFIKDYLKNFYNGAARLTVSHYNAVIKGTEKQIKLAKAICDGVTGASKSALTHNVKIAEAAANGLVSWVSDKFAR